MQDIIALLHQSIGSIGPDCDIIAENIRASRAMEADIIAAFEQRMARDAERKEVCHG